MTISLHGTPRKILFLLLVLAPCVFFLRAVARPWLADRIVAHPTRDSLRRAAEYEPANAERYFAYGRYLQIVEQDFGAAAWNFRAATELNARRGRYWIALANALHFAGDSGAEGNALHNAVRFDPTNPTVAWDAASFFLARGERADAVREFRVAIEHDPNLAPAAFASLWQVTHDADLLMNEALLPGSTYDAALLDLFVRENQPDAAAELWRRWMQSQDDIAAALAFPYVDYLVTRGAYDEGQRVWNELRQRSSEVRARQSAGNLLSNGDFENAILNGGFEWRYRPNALAALALDGTRFHSGSSSLRIDFNGQTGDDAGIAQLVVLPAGESFAFRGFIRTEEVYSPHGPRFSITDLATGKPLYLSAETIGTTTWTEQRGTIPAAASARLVTLRVTREGDSHITGRAWIDDLSLTTEGRR